jgi:hypothetical protein
LDLISSDPPTSVLTKQYVSVTLKSGCQGYAFSEFVTL